ncbi:hypothetical protein V565_239350, partial [Rhizoctonia solani 123E]
MHIDADDEDLDDDYEDHLNTSELTSKHAVAGQGAVPSKSQQAPVGGQSKKRARPKRKAPIELPGIDAATITKFHDASRLILILGAQPRDPDLLNLMRDFATSVHAGDGAVIYIDPVALQGVQHNHIDIQLQVDVQEALGEVRRQMQRQRNLETSGAGDNYSDADIWFDLIENDIPIRLTEMPASYEGATCCLCNCGITDYLAKCTKCSDCYCYRRVQPENSIDDDSDSDEDEEPGKGSRANLPQDASMNQNLIDSAEVAPLNAEAQGELADDKSEDTFPFYEACIAFNALSGVSPLPPLSTAVESFVCPQCWAYRESGLYPHYVRPIPRESVENKKLYWPRMAMVVFYVEQFWPHTKQFMSLTAGRWKQLGWECILEPVKLQHLAERENVFRDLSWDKGTYQVVAVYITHGLDGQQGYQLNNSEGLRPAELLTQTLRIAEKVLEGASSSTVFFLSCGHPLHQPLLVEELRQWIDR